MRPLLRAPRSFLLCALATFFVATAVAQDTRTVQEPMIPPACITLKARLAAHAGRLSDAQEHALDTMRMQKAIGECPRGEAVALQADGDRQVFLSGPLVLRPGVTLLIDAGTVLAASRDPRVYDLQPGSCGVVNSRGHGCKPLISVDGPDSGVMGDGSIDGRGGETLLGQKVTWWDLAHQAKVTDQNQSVPWMLVLHHADNFKLYRITLRNSPGFHVAVDDTNGFTAWDVKIMTPRTARNTDGIDPSSSRNVTIAYSYIHAGDDDVAVKSGRSGPSSDISVVHDHFYTGHGMSIGSNTNGGIDHLLVDDLTIDGADNGIRIKSDRSRGGLVHDVRYHNVCIRNVKNPLVITPLYTTRPGDLLPVYRDIVLSDVHILTPGSYTLIGLDAQHRLGLQLDNVFADGQDRSRVLARDAAITIGPHRGNFDPRGTDVALTTMPGSTSGVPLRCADRFVPFPALPQAPELAGAGR